MKRIDLHQPSLAKQKVTEQKGCFIQLEEKFIRLRLAFKADEPVIDDDEKSGWENRETDYEVVALKKKLAAIEFHWLNLSKRFRLTISVDGLGEDIKIYFVTRQKAIEVYDTILNYMLDGNKD